MYEVVYNTELDSYIYYSLVKNYCFLNDFFYLALCETAIELCGQLFFSSCCK